MDSRKICCGDRKVPIKYTYKHRSTIHGIPVANTALICMLTLTWLQRGKGNFQCITSQVYPRCFYLVNAMRVSNSLKVEWPWNDPNKKKIIHGILSKWLESSTCLNSSLSFCELTDQILTETLRGRYCQYHKIEEDTGNRKAKIYPICMDSKGKNSNQSWAVVRTCILNDYEIWVLHQ